MYELENPDEIDPSLGFELYEMWKAENFGRLRVRLEDAFNDIGFIETDKVVDIYIDRVNDITQSTHAAASVLLSDFKINELEAIEFCCSVQSDLHSILENWNILFTPSIDVFILLISDVYGMNAIEQRKTLKYLIDRYGHPHKDDVLSELFGHDRRVIQSYIFLILPELKTLDVLDYFIDEVLEVVESVGLQTDNLVAVEEFLEVILEGVRYHFQDISDLFLRLENSYDPKKQKLQDFWLTSRLDYLKSSLNGIEETVISLLDGQSFSLDDEIHTFMKPPFFRKFQGVDIRLGFVLHEYWRMAKVSEISDLVLKLLDGKPIRKGLRMINTLLLYSAKNMFMKTNDPSMVREYINQVHYIVFSTALAKGRFDTQQERREFAESYDFQVLLNQERVQQFKPFVLGGMRI